MLEFIIVKLYITTKMAKKNADYVSLIFMEKATYRPSLKSFF